MQEKYMPTMIIDRPIKNKLIFFIFNLETIIIPKEEYKKMI